MKRVIQIHRHGLRITTEFAAHELGLTRGTVRNRLSDYHKANPDAVSVEVSELQRSGNRRRTIMDGKQRVPMRTLAAEFHVGENHLNRWIRDNIQLSGIIQVDDVRRVWDAYTKDLSQRRYRGRLRSAKGNKGSGIARLHQQENMQRIWDGVFGKEDDE
jgi:hypothetical protein